MYELSIFLIPESSTDNSCVVSIYDDIFVNPASLRAILPAGFVLSVILSLFSRRAWCHRSSGSETDSADVKYLREIKSGVSKSPVSAVLY